MFRLLDIDKNNNVIITPEALMVEAFGNLWKRDKTKDKVKATKELAYVWYFSHFDTPYNSYSKSEKHVEILKDVFGDSKYIIDDAVLEACKHLEKMERTFSLRFLEATKKAAWNLIDFFENVDLRKDVDINGRPIYKPSELTSAIGQCHKIIESIDKWTVKVQQELSLGDDKIRGGGSVGMYEDPK